MSEQMNAPMLPAPSGVSAWLSTWREAITQPSEQTFARMAQSPQAKSTTAFLWIFVTSLLSSFLASLVQGALVRQMLQNSDLGVEQFGGPGNTIISVVCGAPIAAVILTVVFAALVGVVQLVAKMFGGIGTYDQLAYALGAILAPYYLLSGFVSLLAAIPVPFVGLCFGALGFIVGLYVVVLEVMAVKGVNQFGWGQAAGSVLLPLLVLACCIAAVVAGLVSMLAPIFRETFDQIPPNFAP
ncbi:MAG TPA: Yip1 family protein [Anaerolineales bacterium]|nr:Yip1 family protein [Anaerolineales bacterium]